MRVDLSLGREAYRLQIGDEGVELVAGGEPGAFYGADTLSQLIAAGDGGIPVGIIEDEPALAQRGVMLDVSRSRVPTMATLYEMVDRLAHERVNHLELYIEHTFAYRGHEEVWEGLDPFTAEELRALDAYCAERHISLVANQNTLGHFERWLVHPRYRPLAARPEGFVGPDDDWREPSTLDPQNPAARALVEDLLGQLLEVLPSHQVNIGLDEPWELIGERSEEWSEWLGWLARLPVLSGKELLVWGDMLTRHPELLATLPGNVVVCEWGYEAEHPFFENVSAVAAAGRPFWCCPGTSSWNSVAGRLANARENCQKAALAAIELGGEGLLVTDWGDGACQQYLPFIEAPLALGVADGWSYSPAASHEELGALVGRRVFGDSSGAIGAAVAGLGNAYLAAGVEMGNASILTRLLFRPTDPVRSPRYPGLERASFEAAESVIDGALDELAFQASNRSDASLLVEEIRAAGEVLRLCCEDGRARFAGDGTLGGIGRAERSRLSRRAEECAERHQVLWLARNRPGGLEESLGPLRRYAAALRAE